MLQNSKCSPLGNGNILKWKPEGYISFPVAIPFILNEENKNSLAYAAEIRSLFYCLKNKTTIAKIESWFSQKRERERTNNFIWSHAEKERRESNPKMKKLNIAYFWLLVYKQKSNKNEMDYISDKSKEFTNKLCYAPCIFFIKKEKKTALC